MPHDRRPVLSVTAADCEWNYSRASGPGGQGVNKSATKVRCVHRASGAAGFSQDTRHQARNKVIAWQRMVSTDEFKRWLKQEHARRIGTAIDVDAEVEKMLAPDQLRIEGKEAGRWVPLQLIGDELVESEPGPPADPGWPHDPAMPGDI